ncbi:type IV secretory system conjugative DNA transfer family protein [Sulfurimonas paralvinellae]|uniref:TraD/TraG TraM recognition site domain-containing protein n=1 Tax=Sulfurimonas paralvinellae TaxID=317658 RepID=A0A7M1B776_9BACT|nr:TraM recognition domain-containing protein [Sulfurimonas paralvinellae]QOP45541.1 hypothetical protein FM071_04285 [Sulfurimonas paralvinellae]
MFFAKTKPQKTSNFGQYAPSSVYGRGLTSVQSAQDELFNEHIPFKPLNLISIEKQFFGLELHSKQPFYMPYEDSTHLLYCGPTRSAKGVALSHRVVEAFKQGKGVIIIDPKKDDFLPQVITEELQRQNRIDDLVIASYPNNFSYSGFDKSDTYREFANKLIVALDLAPSGDPKSDFYRRNERTLLKKVVDIFLNSLSLLDIEFEMNYKSLANFIKYLYLDLSATQNYNHEISKNKPNMDLIERYSKRYFDPDLFQKLELSFDEISTLKGLHQTILELCDANIYTQIDISDALYNGKVIYIQADQLDEASLKMLKILQVDIIQKAKKKRANCIVIADEVSFYATKTLSDSLSTIAGFGVHFILALQDLAQLNDETIKNPILSNCQTKLFYKSSDIETLEYIEKISGLELVTQTTKHQSDITIRQIQEPLLNITRLRALKRDRVAVLIVESLNTPVIVQTWHIEVKQKFDWSKHDKLIFKPKVSQLSKDFRVELKRESFDEVAQEPKKELQL